MTPIETERLVIRNWQDEDRDLFYEINSDPTVMAFFPFRRSRAEADRAMDDWRAAIARDGFGFTPIARKTSNEALGFVGLAITRHVPAFKPETMEIGWRLAERHWGQGYATEAARALLARAFGPLARPEVVSYAVVDNRASRAVMVRLGLTHRPQFDFDHPNVGDDHPHLKRHAFHMIEREAWLSMTR